MSTPSKNKKTRGFNPKFSKRGQTAKENKLFGVDYVNLKTSFITYITNGNISERTRDSFIDKAKFLPNHQVLNSKILVISLITKIMIMKNDILLKDLLSASIEFDSKEKRPIFIVDPTLSNNHKELSTKFIQLILDSFEYPDDEKDFVEFSKFKIPNLKQDILRYYDLISDNLEIFIDDNGEAYVKSVKNDFLI